MPTALQRLRLAFVVGWLTVPAIAFASVEADYSPFQQVVSACVPPEFGDRNPLWRDRCERSGPSSSGAYGHYRRC